jgi:hypothetical protein
LAAAHALGAVSRTGAQACLSARHLMLRRCFPSTDPPQCQSAPGGLPRGASTSVLVQL